MTTQSPFSKQASLAGNSRGNWVRLRTLVALRWLAISGQIAAVLIASQFLNLNLRLDLCTLAIAASVLFNIVALATNPANKRLNEVSVTATLLFDVSQLVVLLYFTGGLSNPFSLLLLAPVTISATVLALTSTLLIGGIAIIAITFLAFYNAPLHLMDGTIISPPSLLITGTWASLVIGIVFVAVYARRITVDNLAMSQALSATQMALAREQQLTALGGVVAAAAHELGTPLATIKLVSTELAEELKDHPDLLEDVNLINSQSERCREILQDMGRGGRDDALLRHAPLSAVVSEAAEPHLNRGKNVILRIDGVAMDLDLPEQPLIPRYPEIIHGVRNLIQNAVDFADQTVWVDMGWSDSDIWLSVGDDGPGYSPELNGLLGEPYVGKRRRGNPANSARPEYQGMGLGLFIAKTLLERTGAELNFSNAPALDIDASDRAQTLTEDASPSGAIVEVFWPRSRLIEISDPTRSPLGRNDLNAP